MVNEEMKKLGNVRSVIREIFEYCKVRKAEIGKDNVFDFSIGNPSVPAPAIVNETIADLAEHYDSIELHGYTSAQGDARVRGVISKYISDNFGAEVPANNIYMTCGAAAGLTISMKALCLPGDEVMAFAPFFPEYKVFSANCGAVLVPVKSDDKLLPDMADFESKITAKTRIVVVNSPNNPSGVVYPESTIKAIASVLEKKQKEYGHPVYILCDEPYRELVYDKATKVPYVMNYYDNTLVCYSWSKSLSIPGDRIGYVAVNPKAADSADVYAAICGAGRSLGFVCAPSMMQFVVEKCIGHVSDLSVYKTNRDLLYGSLTEYGFDCVYPDGAFYLFVKAPDGDSKKFFETAKKHEVLFVPADSFAAPGYVRIAYCVTTEQIKRCLPAFKEIAKEYGLIK